MKWILPVLLLMVSCLNDNQTPESALKSYVEGRIGQVVTREYMLERVTGKMQQVIENISDEEFKKFSDLRNVQRNSFKVLSKSCQEKKCFMTYSITFVTKEGDRSVYSTDVKKIAEVVFVEGKWLIADVSNIKTYHEALEPINPLD